MRNFTLKSNLELGRICGFLFCVAVATMAAGQTAAPVNPILGHGTTGFLPVFSSPGRIANSNVFQSTSGNIGVGTTTPFFPLHILTSSTIQQGQVPTAFFVENPATSDSDNATAVSGLASAGTGSVFGVLGTTYSPGGIGVFGNNPTTTGGGGGGVLGMTSSADFGFSYATRGTATANTGSAVAFFGETFSPDGTAGYFLNRAGGNIIVGHVGLNDDQSVFRVDGTGRVFADGGFQPSGADFAESVAAVGDRSQYAAGDLLVIDPSSNRHLGLSQQPYSTMVAGIYSTKPGILGTTRTIDEPANRDEVPLAVVGIVPCKVTAENGPIHPGDLLVASSSRGHAMKGTDRNKMLGAVVGKALEPLTGGSGVIQVLVTLQ
jgi:hypothetical protein